MRRDDEIPAPVATFIGLMLLGPLLLGIAFWTMTFAVESGRAFWRCVRGEPVVMVVEQ